MKKIVKAAGLLGMIAVLFCAGCSGEKTAIDADGFTKVLEEHDFEITDVTEEEATGGTEQILSAENEDGMEITFYDITDAEVAGEYFAAVKQQLEDSRTSASSTLNKAGSNYEKYTLNLDDMYYSLSRIDDTVVYATCEKSDSLTMGKLVEALGY